MSDANATPEQPDESMEESFGELLDAYDFDLPRRGQVLRGTVVQSTSDAIILDVGLKHDAIVPRDDLEKLDPATLETIQPGVEVSVQVVNPQNQSGEMIVSIYRAMSQDDWERARVLMESADTVEVEVVDVNRGGLLVQFGRLRGFVPQSLTGSGGRTGANRPKRGLVGKPMQVKVIEVNQQRNRLVFSEKAARDEQRRSQIENLKVGDTVSGRVVSLVDYGAFIDIGGVDGLVHISKLDWQHVSHPREILSVGDEVEVQIDDIDLERERISLNRKVLLPSPWESVTQRYKQGNLMTGTVTNIVDFGVFVELEPTVEGLVHVSEMSNFGTDPRKLVRKGDQIPVKVISIDPTRQRIGLSMDRVTSEEQREWLAARSSMPSTRAPEADLEAEGVDAAPETEPEILEGNVAAESAPEVETLAKVDTTEAEIAEVEAIAESAPEAAETAPEGVDEVAEVEAAEDAAPAAAEDEAPRDEA